MDTNTLITRFDSLCTPHANSLFSWLFLLLVTVVGAGAMIYLAPGRNLAASRWNDLWPRIVSSCGLAGNICRTLNCIYVPVNSLFGALALYLCICIGAANLAIVMLHCGQYSVAEYFNQFAPTINGRKTYALITTHCDSRHVCKMKSFVYEPAKIAAIARVYGEDSIQLGHHYQLLANDYLNFALENNKSKYFELAAAEFRFAERFAIKSERICRGHRDYFNTIESIDIIALSRLGRDDKAGARAAVLDALDCPRSLHRIGYCAGDKDLLYVAKQLNEPQLLARVRSMIERDNLAGMSALERFRQSELEPDIDWVEAALFTSLLLIVGKDLERSILTFLFARRWRRQLDLCASGTEEIKLLDNLTALYLYKGKLDKADSCSKHMLRRAEALV
jgi:hypothetical protein